MSDFVVLLPVKPPSRGKSRLTGLAAEDRIALATAFALDTAVAALASPAVAAVLAVTDDLGLTRELGVLGCSVMPDGADTLNESLRQAAAESRRRWPSYGVAALCADLPALRPDELTTALTEVPSGTTVFVADHKAFGTTMYAAAQGAAFAPAFGFRSAELHAGAGAIAIAGELPGLRLDVDEPGDLERALVLGVGPRSAAASGR
jgi:2-phospho-L-lactate guanylyltransferase